MLLSLAIAVFAAAHSRPAEAGPSGGETFDREDGVQTFLNRFIVGVEGSYSASKAQGIADRNDATLHQELRWVRMIILTTDFTTRAEHDRFLLKIASDPYVRFVEADAIIQAVPTLDPLPGTTETPYPAPSPLPRVSRALHPLSNPLPTAARLAASPAGSSGAAHAPW